MFRHYLIAAIVLGTLHLQLYGQIPSDQPPPNDICARAITLLPGDHYPNQTNAGATIPLQFERPATVEGTCIQTIENDIWYKFQAQRGVSLYEVTIVAHFCTTPAGLQALLIKADDCTASKFIYRGCSNKINTDTIKLFLEDPEPGEQYLVWVDGYDGTVCEFEINLAGRKAMLPSDYRFLRFDYTLSEPIVEEPGLNAVFTNNSCTLNWSSDQRDGVSLFIIERLLEIEGLAEESRYAHVVGFVEPHNLVGTGSSNYSFTDYVTPYEQSKPYRYRIISINETGIRSVSQTMYVKAKLVEAFDVREVTPADDPGKYVVRYINRKKGADFELTVVDATGTTLKHMVLQDEPLRDGSVTIDMSTYPAGEYYFVMRLGRDVFKRAFQHIPK